MDETRDTENASPAAVDPNRRAILKATGATTIGLGALAVGPGAAGATGECVDCKFFGKVEGQPEEGDVYEFEKRGTTVKIEVENIRTEDGEVVGMEFVTVGDNRVPICKVVVKGGPNTRTRELDPPKHSAWVWAPDMHSRNPNRDYYAISYISFWFCHPYVPDS